MPVNEKINRIDRAEIFIIKLPLIKPFTTSFGTETHKEALLIRIGSDNFYGWGECVASPAPYYSYETNEIALLVIKNHLIPLMKDQKDFSLEEMLRRFKRIKGHNMAKATVENALLDLLSRKASQPLFSLIGGKSKKISSGISIGIKKNTSELLGFIEGANKKKISPYQS